MTKSKACIYAASLAAGTALAAGAAYLLEIPPFEGVGTIEAGDVCANLGPSSKVVPVIRKMAPPEPSYTFIEQRNQGSVDFFFSACSGKTGDSEFLATRTEVTMLGNSIFESWSNGPASKMVETVAPKNFDRFNTDADTWGVVSKNKAAIVTPCLSHGHQGLTTIVLLRGSAEPEGTAGRYRQELIELATSTAKFAHEDAGCTLPFKI
ncbi:hypothetical protein ABT001_13830 [Streptomyces sp. NPDC002793]|uniref:hypothetical protein n=1 Tax=Streptomyces sp. NPDC002793 TaxID=3154432 RepID=UPI003330D630